MNPRKLLVIAFSIILGGMVFLPAAAANEWDQATKMTFNAAVEIPGKVLPLGSYWFVLADTQGDQQIVQVSNADRTKIYASEETVPTERLQATSRVELKFAERPNHLPEALLKWYYPGQLTGQEFLYPQKVEKGLRLDAKQDVMASPLNSSSTVPMPGE